MKRNLKSLTDLAKEGPFTIDQLRWLVFNATENGLITAVARVGRRVYIDVDAFDDWLRARNPGLRQAPQRNSHAVQAQAA